MERIFWGDYTSNEMKEFMKREPVVLIPVGAYEQHGPHLAMNTDSVIADSICRGIVQKSDTPCVTLPTVWIGISEHHMRFCGSLTLRHATMSALLFDILESLARSGVKKALVVNAHGGNMVPLNEALTRAGQSFDGVWSLLTYWNLISKEIWDIRKSEYGGVSHACEMETSLQMYLDKRNVRMDRLPAANNLKGSEWWSPEMFASNKISLYKPYHELSAEGHIGDPQSATVETGKTIYDLILEKALKLVDAMWKGELLGEDC